MIRGLGLLTMVATTATAALAASTMQPLATRRYAPGTGIPLPLAQERARRISDLRYDLHFSIAAEPGSADHRTRQRSRSRCRTPVDRSRSTSRRRKACAASERPPSRFRTRSFPITSSCQRQSLREGRNEILIDFTAGDEALNRNPEFLYTLFVPARAHLTFPVLRSAGSEGALDAGPRRAGRLAGARQRRRDGATRGRRARST